MCAHAVVERSGRGAGTDAGSGNVQRGPSSKVYYCLRMAPSRHIWDVGWMDGLPPKKGVSMNEHGEVGDASIFGIFDPCGLSS